MIWIKIVKGMYGLKKAGIIANQEICVHLKSYGYEPVRHTPGLWRCTHRFHLHPRCRRFPNSIHGFAQCSPSHQRITKQIRHHDQLGRKNLHWYLIAMGL